jgi:hypothetical protein
MSHDDATAPATTPAGNPGGSLRALHGPFLALMENRVVNPVMRRSLSGRLHRLAGSSTLMVLSFQGRRSGATFTFPVGYMQTGEELVCYTPFRWWVNLTGGARVSVVLRGQRRTGTAEVSTDPAIVADGMAAYLRHNPGDARFWKVGLDGDKVPRREDVDRVAPDNAQVLIRLDPA